MTAAGPQHDVVLRDAVPAEACGMCGVFAPSNLRLAVVRLEASSPTVAETAACDICLEHYGADGIANRLWPDLCDWTPLKVLEDCQCETCTGQIEFRFNAGTDFYE
jgi:hypothetical protein